jgi:hypothetical protein
VIVLLLSSLSSSSISEYCENSDSDGKHQRANGSVSLDFVEVGSANGESAVAVESVRYE